LKDGTVDAERLLEAADIRGSELRLARVSAEEDEKEIREDE